jgi:beta-N-acetylhexosaminidase
VLLISDDLQMQGLQRKVGTLDGALLGLRAGLDLLCIGNNLLDEQAQMEELALRIEEEAALDARLAQHLDQARDRIARRKATAKDAFRS